VILYDYGFTHLEQNHFDEIIKEKGKTGLLPARVIEARREKYRVICDSGELGAEIKGRFFHISSCTSKHILLLTF